MPGTIAPSVKIVDEEGAPFFVALVVVLLVVIILVYVLDRPAISTSTGATGSAVRCFCFFFFLSAIVDDDEEEEEEEEESPRRHCSTGSRLTHTDLGLPVVGSSTTSVTG